MSKISKNGFTLVELAIVIVIIGLIIGGVVGAQSLIKSSQIQSTVNEFNKIQTAYHAFKLEYDAIPGDFREASLYFTSDISGGSSIRNGDGDKRVSGQGEIREFFSHLRNAEIINNCECMGAEIGFAVPDKVYPVSSLRPEPVTSNSYTRKNFVYKVHYRSSKAGNDTYKTLGNNLSLTGVRWMGIDGTYTYGWYYYTSYIYTTLGKTTYKIDKKMDDGKPFTGLMRSTTDIRCVSGQEYNKTSVELGSCEPSILLGN